MYRTSKVQVTVHERDFDAVVQQESERVEPRVPRIVTDVAVCI
jgi:hypothetical protein